jgi:DNA-binding NtrC family response regulator
MSDHNSSKVEGTRQGKRSLARALVPPLPQETKDQGRQFAKALLDLRLPYKQSLHHVRALLILEALSRSDNSPARAAELLHVNDETVRQVMAASGIRRVAAVKIEEPSL